MGITISYHGIESTGKTTFALTGPMPMTMFDFDLGFERAAPRFNQAILSQIKRIKLPEPPEWALGSGQATKLWAGFKQEWRNWMNDRSRPGGFIDTGTTLWKADCQEYLENYVMQKNKSRRQLQREEYREPNDRMSALIKEIRDSDKVLFISHQETDDYEEAFVTNNSGSMVKESRKNGKRVHHGFGDMVYLADIHLRFYLKVGAQSGYIVPHCQVQKSGLAPLNMLGMEIENPTYPLLMRYIQYYRAQEPKYNGG